MHESLNQNVFLVKEHVGAFKAANNYDIHDPQTGQVILLCREPHLGGFTKLLRFTEYKRMTPFDVRITTPGPLALKATQSPVVLVENLELPTHREYLLPKPADPTVVFVQDVDR